MAQESENPIVLQSPFPGNYGIIVRTGQAPNVYDPNPIRESGIITAPLDFYKARKGSTREHPFDGLVDATYFPKEYTFVKVNRKAGQISLIWDDYSQFRQYINGNLQTSEYYDVLGINDYSRLRTPLELATILKRYRFLLSDKEGAMKLVSDLSKFKAQISTNVEQSKDDRANKKNLIETSVQTEIPVSFEVNIAPFKGFPPEKFMVSICLETQGQSISCYLESVQMLEYFDAMKDTIFDNILDAFMQDGIPIIEQ